MLKSPTYPNLENFLTNCWNINSFVFWSHSVSHQAHQSPKSTHLKNCPRNSLNTSPMLVETFKLVICSSFVALKPLKCTHTFNWNVRLIFAGKMSSRVVSWSRWPDPRSYWTRHLPKNLGPTWPEIEPRTTSSPLTTRTGRTTNLIHILLIR